MNSEQLIRDVYEKLGSINAQLQAHAASQVRIETNFVNHTVTLDSELKAISDRLAAFDIVADDVREMKPIVQDYQKLRQNVHGGVVILLGIGSMLLLLAGFFLERAWSWVIAHVR